MKKFAKNKKILAILPACIFIIGWEIFARSTWINPVLFPAPTQTLIKLVNLFKKGLPVRSELITHILSTLKRLTLGFLLGVTSGILFGTMMGLSNLMYYFFNPFISILMPIPGIALAPLFIIWFGFGDPTIIALGTLSTFFPIVYSTSAGIRSVDRQMIRAAQTMGVNPLQIIYEVYIPWSAAYIFNGVKLGLARGWMTIIAVEFVAASNWGLGYMIWNATEYLQADTVYGGIFVMILIFILLEKILVSGLEKRTVAKWGMITQK